MRRGVAACCLVTLAIAGCGGGGTSSSTVTSTATPRTAGPTGPAATSGKGDGGQPSPGLTDAQGVRAAVEAALASSDPSQACGTYVTQRYLEAAYGGRQGCIQAQAPGSAAKSLNSLKARIHGDRATATAVPVGGPYDGSKVTATLVQVNGAWKVDALHANVPVGP